MRWRWSIPPTSSASPASRRSAYLRAGRPHDLVAIGRISSNPACRRNSVIAVQLPNTIEFALTVLAAFRAGLVVAVLPLLWRQSELTMALNRTAARAIVTIEQDRRRDLFGHRHERRRRSVLDPPCLRLRQRPARRHGLARQRDLPGIPDHARRDPGRPQGGADFLRRHLGRLSAGSARPSRPDCRRALRCRSKATCRRAQPSCRPSRRCRLPASPRRWRSGCCRAARWCCTIRSTRRCWNSRSTNRPATR